MRFHQTHTHCIMAICAGVSPDNSVGPGIYSISHTSFHMSLVEQELLTVPEHLSSPRFLVGFVLLDLQFYMYVLQIGVCPFVLFLLAITLILITPFGILKLFLLLYIHSDRKIFVFQLIQHYCSIVLIVCSRWGYVTCSIKLWCKLSQFGLSYIIFIVQNTKCNLQIYSSNQLFMFKISTM